MKLSINNLCIGHNHTTLISDINLTAKSGELVSMVGANGKGKSTLLKTLSGELKTLGGQITLEGEDINKLSPIERAKKMSIVLTSRIDTSRLTVRDVIALGRSPYTNWQGKMNDADNEMVQNAIDCVNIDNLADKNIDELSDGESQKVMIARAICQDTPIILLDEPTAHLDIPNRIGLLNLLEKLAHKQNKIIILATHEVELALTVSDKLWMIGDGWKGVKSEYTEDAIKKGSLDKLFNGLKFEGRFMPR